MEKMDIELIKESREKNQSEIREQVVRENSQRNWGEKVVTETSVKSSEMKVQS